MVKQLLLSASFVFAGLYAMSQNAISIGVQSGSSTSTNSSTVVRGWVGTRVAFVEADPSTSTVTGIQTQYSKELVSLDASLFPNPVVQVAKLTVDTENSYVIRVFDNQGRDITPLFYSAKSFTTKTLDLNLSELSVGAYYLEIRTLDGEKGKTIKFVKTIN